MEPSLLNQGLGLMLVGMGTVFVFLTLLVIAMSAMGGIVRRLSPTVVDGPSEDEVAAITAAIVAHRRKNS
jgi:oxaloacetate decarboxylase gamma subunit